MKALFETFRTVCRRRETLAEKRQEGVNETDGKASPVPVEHSGIGGYENRSHAQRPAEKTMYTPEMITRLEADEVFVFGSNLAGKHGGGAARTAYERFGAVWGKGVGHYGQTYAIPTMHGGVEAVRPYVDEFLRYAAAHPGLRFLVTRIGCGIAGFRDSDIAPLFAAALDTPNIVLPRSFAKLLAVPKPPHHLRTKVYGQTRTMVDMLVALNKQTPFDSPLSALSALVDCLNRLQGGGDKVAFDCSLRNLAAFASSCFEDGRLQADKLEQLCVARYEAETEQVYARYVVEKMMTLVAYMNEFRRYTDARDLIADFRTATGVGEHGFSHSADNYFELSPHFFTSFLFPCLTENWEQISTRGVLDNAKLRDFMLDRHARDVAQLGLDAVLARDYVAAEPCHPERHVPRRGLAGPVYMELGLLVRQGDPSVTRRYVAACTPADEYSRLSCCWEFAHALRLLETDEKYRETGGYFVPKTDPTLPVYYRWEGQLNFEDEAEKRAFLERLAARESSR